MKLTAEMLRRIAKTTPNATNAASFIGALDKHGAEIGIDQPHRLAQLVPQVMTESGGLKNSKEIWGPTAAQKGYEGRKDLGNTQKGDGSKYRGYGANEIAKFQRNLGLVADGISGPLTRSAMHKALVALTAKPEQSKQVQSAPVVEEVKVPVKLGEPEKPFWQSPAFIATTGTGGLVTTAVANVGTIPWQNLVVLVAAAFLGLVGYLVYDHIQSRKKQEAKAEAIKS